MLEKSGRNNFCSIKSFIAVNAFNVSIIRFFFIYLGDILIFMPGQEDIEVTCELIAGQLLLHFSHLHHRLGLENY